MLDIEKISRNSCEDLAAYLSGIKVRNSEIAAILGRYGENHQILKTIEELGELSHILCRILQKKIKLDRNDPVCEREILLLTGELADVYLTLKQIKKIFGIRDNDLIFEMRVKIDRMDLPKI